MVFTAPWVGILFGRVLLLALLLLSPPRSFSQGIMISEVMASNSSIISDEDGDYCDWIEIYNYGDHPLDIKGYGLSDSYNDPYRWTFPDITIKPGEYLLVWASGKNRREDKGALHTGFAIDTRGEEIILSGPSDNIIDKLEPASIPTDISIGRKPGDRENWYFFDTPTPGEPNTGIAYKGILDPPDFSRKGGFYKSSFMLELHAGEGSSIYFTLDGSVPDPLNTAGSSFKYKDSYPVNPYDSPYHFIEGSFQSHLYLNPILVSDKTGMESIAGINTGFSPDPGIPRGDVLQGTVVRARVFRDGYLPSPVRTHTFLVGDNIDQRFQLPVISISVPDSSLFEYHRGIYTAGRAFDEWRMNNPADPVWPAAPANWGRRGRAWEREVYMELFGPRGEPRIGQGLGVRIHGGWSRSNRKKSLRFYARNIYDTETHIHHVFFPGRGSMGPLECDTDIFKRLLIRSGGNAMQMVRDVTAQDMMTGMRIGLQRAEPAVHFINGVYWGLVNIRDRQDRYHIAYEYGADPDDVIVLDSPYKPVDYTQLEEGVVEDTGYFNIVYDFITGNDMSDPGNFDLAGSLLDIESYMDYYTGMIYLANGDWGGRDNPGSKHFRFWRLRDIAEGPYSDGRWRVMVWDFDNAFTDVEYALLTDVMDPSTEASAMLLSLMENEEFRIRFINRFADLMNTSFLPSHANSLLDERIQAVVGEALHDMDRWGTNPLAGISHIREFINDRTDFQREEITGIFGLSGTSMVNLKTDADHGKIRINSIEIESGLAGVEDPADWTGIYFNGIPVEVEAIPGSGMVFSHWIGLQAGTPARTTIDLESDTRITAVFWDGLLHYWNFNALPAHSTHDTVIADYSLYHPDAVMASAYNGEIEIAVNGTEINTRRGSESGYAMLLNGSGKGSEVEFSFPVSWHSNLCFSYAAMSKEGGKQVKSVFISSDGGHNWTSLSKAVMLSGKYALYEHDISEFLGDSQDPELMVRIRVDKAIASEVSGGTLFDNFAVSEKSLELDDIFLPPGKKDEKYSASLEASFGRRPFIYEVVSGSLPEGVYLTGSGQISGVPVREGSYTFEVEVRDKLQQYARKTFTIRVFGDKIVHYWHFNDLCSGRPDTVFADYSAVPEKASVIYPGDGDAWLDRAEGSEINSLTGIPGGYGLRVRNPSNRRELRIITPSTGYDYLQLSYAVHRTANGARWQFVQYSTDGGLNWESAGPPFRVTTDYQERAFDLRYIEDAGDNPDLMFRIFFMGPESAGEDGNNRFDNIILKGVTAAQQGRRESLLVYPNPVTGRTIYMMSEEEVRLFDSSGRLIGHWENTRVLYLPRLSPGYYILVARDGRYARIFYPG